MRPLADFHGAGAYALALIATLVLAAWLTPGRWWRRPNARALAILVTGTWGLGSLVLWLAHSMPSSAATADATAATPIAPAAHMTLAAPAPTLTATAGLPFRVHRDVNLRAGAGTDTTRIGVVHRGASVTPTGLRHGDWWQVSTRLADSDVTGWISSLWLRQPKEESGLKSTANSNG